MAINIEQSRLIGAPVERVWPLMTDVNAIANCMPGAELSGPSNQGGYEGSVSVRIGPLAMKYRGRLEVLEALDDVHQVKFVGKGRDSAGSGTAQLNVTANAADEGGATRLRFVSQVQLTGRAAMLGRGVEEVAGVVLSEFLDNFAKLAADSSPAEAETLAATGPRLPGSAEDDVARAADAMNGSGTSAARAPALGAARLTGIVVGGWFRRLGRRIAGWFRRK
jgi:carbon monoxide dehydrogenase subunit G